MAKLGMLKNTQSHTGTQDSRAVVVTVKDIPIGDIHIKDNIRKEYTGIEELAASIRQHGLLQPITVYHAEDGYAVKTGHRRFMAYKRLYQEDPERFHSIRCIVSDAQNIELIQLVENVQRVDLSQLDLFNSLNQLREQGMTLRQIAEVIGKTEGYIKNLFVGINEINKDETLKNLIGHAGVTINDIAETNAVTDKNQRMILLNERKNGTVNRAQMREKVKELSAKSIVDSEKPLAVSDNGKSTNTNISIKAFPSLNKIIIYLTKGGCTEELKSLEDDLRVYLSTNGKYRIEKKAPDKDET